MVALTFGLFGIHHSLSRSLPRCCALYIFGRVLRIYRISIRNLMDGLKLEKNFSIMTCVTGHYDGWLCNKTINE